MEIQKADMSRSCEGHNLFQGFKSSINQGNGYTQTVLVVDDDKDVREVFKEILNHLGYKVLIRSDGKDALELISTMLDHAKRPDLVILDMIMPGMKGDEVYDGIRNIDPDIKVLFASGYGVEERMRSLLARDCNGFIQKPFSIKELSEKLREVMD